MSDPLALIHPSDVKLWHAMVRATHRLAGSHSIQVQSIVPTPRQSVNSFFGRAHFEDAKIEYSLRSFKHGKWQPREPLWRYLDTICHEVAHLAMWQLYEDDSHGPDFMRQLGYFLGLSENLKLRKYFDGLGLKD